MLNFSRIEIDRMQKVTKIRIVRKMRSLCYSALEDKGSIFNPIQVLELKILTNLRPIHNAWHHPIWALLVLTGPANNFSYLLDFFVCKNLYLDN